MRALLATFILLLTTLAHGGVVTLDYSLSSFQATGPTPPPAPTVNGVITYRADSMTGPIQQLLSIDMTIAGHAYSTAELGFVNDLFNTVIGGSVAGASAVIGSADDFSLTFVQGPTQFNFFYGVEGTSTVWLTTTGTLNISFADGSTSVAEPGTLGLLGLGIAGIAASRTRRYGRGGVVGPADGQQGTTRT